MMGKGSPLYTRTSTLLTDSGSKRWRHSGMLQLFDILVKELIKKHLNFDGAVGSVNNKSY